MNVDADSIPRMAEPGPARKALCMRCERLVEDFMTDRYDGTVICHECVTDVEFSAGTVDVERRLSELEHENSEIRRRERIYVGTLEWIKRQAPENAGDCPALLGRVQGAAVVALCGMRPMGVK